MAGSVTECKTYKNNKKLNGREEVERIIIVIMKSSVCLCMRRKSFVSTLRIDEMHAIRNIEHSHACVAMCVEFALL